MNEWERARTVLCELYRGSTLIWSGYKTFEGNETIKDTYSVYYPGTATHTLTAKINYANRNSETDPNDNMRTRDVTPVKPTDGTYDFSVSEIAVTPGTVFEGDTVTVTFRSDNWNKDVSYSHIPVELLIDGQVVKTEYVKEIDLSFLLRSLHCVYASAVVQRHSEQHHVSRVRSKGYSDLHRRLPSVRKTGRVQHDVDSAGDHESIRRQSRTRETEKSVPGVRGCDLRRTICLIIMI